jgi:hypothetical protein
MAGILTQDLQIAEAVLAGRVLLPVALEYVPHKWSGPK